VKYGAVIVVVGRVVYPTMAGSSARNAVIGFAKMMTLILMTIPIVWFMIMAFVPIAALDTKMVVLFVLTTTAMIVKSNGTIVNAMMMIDWDSLIR
jgi:hypothetical protein